MNFTLEERRYTGLGICWPTYFDIGMRVIVFWRIDREKDYLRRCLSFERSNRQQLKGVFVAAGAGVDVAFGGMGMVLVRLWLDDSVGYSHLMRRRAHWLDYIMNIIALPENFDSRSSGLGHVAFVAGKSAFWMLRNLEARHGATKGGRLWKPRYRLAVMGLERAGNAKNDGAKLTGNGGQSSERTYVIRRVLPWFPELFEIVVIGGGSSALRIPEHGVQVTVQTALSVPLGNGTVQT
ncbi:hypothetical protein EDD15DRAFT_2193422 [Pisolithus albus]|nr:hypothetical protein EDD15DRAFT_2193422 [Pisolithus albus]